MEECNILYQIKTLECLIAKDIIKKIFSEGDISNHPSPTQMMILDYLMKTQGKDVYQKDLESVFNLTRATISGVLQTMEKNGLILRVISESDTRVKKIMISSKTKMIFESNKKRLDNIEKVMIKGINEKDLTQFLCVLEKMRDNLKDL